MRLPCGQAVSQKALRPTSFVLTLRDASRTQDAGRRTQHLQFRSTSRTTLLLADSLQLRQEPGAEDARWEREGEDAKKRGDSGERATHDRDGIDVAVAKRRHRHDCPPHRG